jgi:hypothetical protein
MAEPPDQDQVHLQWKGSKAASGMHAVLVGLHIWYSLVLPPPASFDDATEKMRQLHDAAHTVGFTGHDEIPAVGEIDRGWFVRQARSVILGTCEVSFSR